jgi:hypothetical protein
MSPPFSTQRLLELEVSVHCLACELSSALHIRFLFVASRLDSGFRHDRTTGWATLADEQ